MWLVWFLLSTHWFSIWNAIIVAVCNNIVLFVRLPAYRMQSHPTPWRLFWARSASDPCYNCFLVRRCGSYYCPVFQSPLHCDRLAVQFHVDKDFSLCYWLLADLLQNTRGRDETELLFLALEEIMSYVSFSMHLPVFTALKK